MEMENVGVHSVSSKMESEGTRPGTKPEVGRLKATDRLVNQLAVIHTVPISHPCHRRIPVHNGHFNELRHILSVADV